jgi:hypothetical protein
VGHPSLVPDLGQHGARRPAVVSAAWNLPREILEGAWTGTSTAYG